MESDLNGGVTDAGNHQGGELRGKSRMSLLRERPIAILPGQYFDAESGLRD
jgi:hypothetical protein